MRRIGVVVGTAVLGLALAGCGGAPTVDVASAVGVDGQALAALGFNPADVVPPADPLAQASPTPEPSASTKDARQKRDDRRDRRRTRVLLRENTLHGEVVVRTEDGTTKTVAVQRGEVTAIDGTSMTVKSTDGYTATWTFGENLRVVERRTSVQPSDIKVGTKVGVAGANDAGRFVARLIVVPKS